MTVSDPLTEKYGAPESEIEFWHELSDRAVTSYDEALHGMILFVDPSAEVVDYESRVQWLKGRGLLPAGWDRPGDQAVDRGTVALMITRQLGIKGGIMLSLFPDWDRYAVREMIFHGLYPPASSPNQTFTGAEYLGIIGKMEDFFRNSETPRIGLTDPNRASPGAVEPE